MIAIYSRQSLDKKDSISIDVQIDFCKKEFDNSQEYKVYTDKGYSGKNIQRPAFSELMADVESGKISKIVVYRLDRISRSITDFANIIEILEKSNVAFVSSTEKFDTSTPMGRAMVYIVMVFAQLERETIAERIRDNYYARGKQGFFLGGPAPFGYDNNKIKIDNKNITVLQANDDIEIVKRVFIEYANTNKSLGSIAKGLKSEYGDKYGVWNNIKLSRILHNPVYVKADSDIYQYYKNLQCILPNEIEEFIGVNGCSLYGKRDRGANKYRNLTENTLALSLHNGVVSSNLFLKCQYKLVQNKQIKNSGKGKHSWLTGIIKCGYCGYSMTIKKYQYANKVDKKYLSCSGKANNNCDTVLDTNILLDVENYVESEIIKFISNLSNDNVKVEETQNIEANRIKIELYDIEMQIEKLINNLSVANDVLITYINNKIVELDEMKKSKIAELEKCTFANSSCDMPTIEEWQNADFEKRKAMVLKLISKVYVKNGKIKIEWNY